MRETITYVADDGTEFYKKEECAEYEKDRCSINELLSTLEPRPDVRDTCVQQNRGVFLNVRKELLRVIKKYVDHSWIAQAIDDEGISPWYIGRLLDDSKFRGLRTAWNRIMFTDKLYREWDQLYNTNKANDQMY